MIGRLRRCIVALCVSASVGACGEPAPVAPRLPTKGLAVWEGVYRDLFDDGIDPVALGFSLDGASPATDPLLAPRTSGAELVARMRVQTVSRDANGERTRYFLGVQVGQPPLTQGTLQDLTLDLAIAEGTAAFQLVSASENSLRGRTFIGFVRRFVSDDGATVRWHMTADTAEVAHAVQVAAALNNLSE
jgi:hypothetical protein